MKDLKLFTGAISSDLSKRISDELGISLGSSSKTVFSDGEFETRYEEPVRGSEVFIIQSTARSSESLMELLLMVDAAKRASAKSVIAVIPYFGWARQDRKAKPRCSFAAKLVANLLTTAGVDRIITIDIHADQIQGFFDVPVDSLYASSVFVPDIENLALKDMVIASPDAGGAKRANQYADYFDVPLVLCHKHRIQDNQVESMAVIGDVANKDVVIVDDMVDTAGTLCKAATLMREKGASSVRAYISHPVMSGPATERIAESALDELVVSDSIPYVGTAGGKLRVVSVAPLLATVIKNIHNNCSISNAFLLK